MDTTLDALVDRVRRLIGDPAGPDQHFDRDEIEETMNRYRYDAVRYPLHYVLAPSGSGAERVYTTLGWWAADTILKTGAGTVVTPNTIDAMSGSWSFTAPQIYPLYATGRTFDLYAAAADLLESWSAILSREHSVQIGDIKLERGQKRASLMELAKLYQGKRRITSAPIIMDTGAVGDYRQLTAPPPM
jgi:hypothetical protein